MENEIQYHRKKMDNVSYCTQHFNLYEEPVKKEVPKSTNFSSKPKTHLPKSSTDSKFRGFGENSGTSSKHKKSKPQYHGNTSGLSNEKLQRELKKAFAVLGISQGASFRDITVAYREKALLFHPDKIKTQMQQKCFNE